jgi:TonB-linked SusC/RagA family outer membrane protein
MSLAIAQNKQVSGTVVDETGEPVIGASVVVKGNTVIGTVTNLDGKFTLEVPVSAEKLIVRYLGKQDQEVAAEPNINVTLQPSDTSLDEVIVVAYGTAKKSSFTGSASTIKGEKLEKIQTSNLSKSLEGSVSGLQTTSGSGQPGASASIVIRGLGSISASRNPLIILDGIPYEGSLNSISTYDIESCTVLKDAAANSLYGARGSNGVIIITTKKGKSGKTIVNFDARAGFNTRGISTYDVITDPGEYYEMYWESLRNKNLADGASYLEANAAASANLIGNLKYNRFKNVPDAELVNPITGKLNPNATTRKWDDNWITDPFRKGLRQEYNVNVSQGTENSNIYASVSYLDDNGYVVNSDFKRITTLLKGEQRIGDYFKVNGTIGYTNASTNNVGSSTTQYNNIFMFGQQIAPIYPIYLYDQTGNHLLDKNGNKRYDFGTEYARPYASEQNPVATIEADIKKIVVDNLTVKGTFEAKFLKDFTFTVNAAYDVFNMLNTDFATPIGGDAATVGGRGEKTMQRYSALNINQILNYKKSLDDHNFDVLLVHETKFDNVKLLYGHMTNFVDPANPEFSNAARYQDLTSQEESYSLEGYLGKADYNFKDTYYLTASLRRDGSSRFHKDNRWGNFWAAGASWRISKEEFLSDVDFINELKLKTSYGTQGNDNIINADGFNIWYAYQNLYTVSRIDGEPSTSLSYRGNPALTWEKSNNFNAGIELDAWENRVLLNADFFIKETTDLLYAKPLAISEGLPSVIYVNDIDMRNTGFEVELGVDIIKTNDLKWNINLNATHYKNKLTRLPSDKADLIAKDGGYQAGGYWRKIGGSIYDYYTYEYAGVDKNGKALYNVYEEQRDDNGVLTGFEKKEPTTVQSNATLRETGKSPISDLYGGIGSTLEFAGVDFSIQTAYQLGGYVMDDVYQTLMNAGENGENFHKDMFQRWTPENRETNIPKLLYEDRDQNAVSDRWLTDASYFSLRNITLGYTFPKKWLKSVKIEKLRVYGVADNVWYTSKRTGLDVRQSFTGAVSYIYSPLRTISFGVQLSF